MVANHTLASHMHMALTSPATPWFEILFREAELNRDDSAREWLEDCNQRMFEAINESDDGKLLPAVGAGFRFTAFPDNHMNVGLDAAVGDGDWGIYFRIGEAF